MIERYGLVIRNGAQDVREFLRRGGQAEVATGQRVRAGVGDLDFQVGREKGQRVAFLFDQHVGQNRQGMAPLDDAGDGLERF